MEADVQLNPAICGFIYTGPFIENFAQTTATATTTTDKFLHFHLIVSDLFERNNGNCSLHNFKVGGLWVL